MPKETEMTIRPMTPYEFGLQMKELHEKAESYSDADGYYDVEESHKQADYFMSDMLKALGYEQGAKTFDKMRKWYT